MVWFAMVGILLLIFVTYHILTYGRRGRRWSGY
jgi:hypothetical protein